MPEKSRRRSPWPTPPEPPAPMTPQELLDIAFSLASSYGVPYRRMPFEVLAPAVGLKTSRQMYRWANGTAEIPGSVAKLLRLFHAQSRIF